ncbi:hypothetical protein [Nonomuraea candida]|uniref:hypothetical protein n=1 Tax=Nonomuraea candida TaxID=359159 RepID=UPI000A545D07|nr:hypothetical protein [Nonomuraea candida]
MDSAGKKKASATAKGILSAGGDPWFGDCFVYYTDIDDIRRAYGGNVLISK